MDTMKRFYSSRYIPKDGETILYDGREFTAHVKSENEGCERCCFEAISGCALDCEKLSCFDRYNDRRIYFTEGEDHEEKKKADTEEG